MFVGLLGGSLTSNYIYEYTSTQFMFGLATMLAFCAVFYIKFGVMESVLVAPENNTDALVREH